MSITLSNNWSGLCNQIFALISGIINNKHLKKISVGTFAPMLNSNLRVKSSKIFDFEKISNNIGIILNDGPDKNRSSFAWYTSINEQLFEEYLPKIYFAPIFYKISENIFSKIGHNSTLNVVHFRIEYDGIKHWSNMNRMSTQQFTTILYNNYRQAIYNNIPKGERILALTFDCKHTFIKELTKDYQIECIDIEKELKNTLGFTGREICAIIDLLVGIKCNNIFIGCHNFELKRGSSFSYVLWKLMKDVKKGIFMDLDNIIDTLKIIEK